MALTSNQYTWKPGQSGNPRGRPRKDRKAGIWSERAARDAFLLCSTPEQRRRAAKLIYELACQDPPVRWALRAVAQAKGLDWDSVQAVGRIRPKTYFVG